MKLLGVAFNTFILVEYEDHLLMIDQHAVHERLLFDRMMKAFDQHQAGQELLIPMIVNVTRREQQLLMEHQDMLESIGYTGYANFDIKCGDDPNSANSTDFRLFEINLRHGRSNYYMTAAGVNVAELACEVYESEGDDCNSCENEVFWHLIPKSVAYAYTDDEAMVEKAKALTRAGKESSSLWYPADMLKNPLRLICVLEQLRRQKKKYKTYCKKYR